MPALARSRDQEIAIVRIRQWVVERLGIHYPDHKLCVLESKLSELCRELQVDSLSQLSDKIHCEGSGVQSRVAHAVSTNHTGFFREPATFSRFSKEVLPSLSSESEVRIWSAASSTGEEAYTVAMVVLGTMGLEWARSRCRILATDLSRDVIASAQKGLYRSIESVPSAERSNYFVPSNGVFKVCHDVRELCLFRTLNLVGNNWPFRQRFQVVFCRNILYYFKPDSQARVLRRMHAACATGGWLVTSVTESIRGLDVPWRSVGAGIYRKDI